MTIPASGRVNEPSLTQLNPTWKDWLDAFEVFAVPQCSRDEKFCKEFYPIGLLKLLEQKKGGTALVAPCRQSP
jgi:hypothetical protein